MAFVFTVEDGTGLPAATSYVSVSEANDILAVNIHITATWGALSTQEKEKLLSWASQFIDSRARWNGYKTVESSALRWPRTGVYDRDSIEIPSNIVPQQLKEAVSEMARLLATEDRTIERSQDGLKRLKVDSIEIEFSEGYRLPNIPTSVANMLIGLGSVSTGAGIKFKRLVR